MTPKLVTPATALAVTLESVKANLKISHSRLDSVLDMWIRGVTANAENLMQRSLIRQTWSVTLDAFPLVDYAAGAIMLRRAPVLDVVSIKFYDVNNVRQTLSPEDYDVDSDSEPGWIVPAAGFTWPSTFNRVKAVQVLYRCGYGDDSTTTPDPIKLYLLAKIKDMFSPQIGNLPPPPGKPYTVNFIDSMLDDYVIYD